MLELLSAFQAVTLQALLSPFPWRAREWTPRNLGESYDVAFACATRVLVALAARALMLALVSKSLARQRTQRTRCR